MGMLTQLSTVKTRLGITDSSSDTILIRVINAVSSRFELYCNRSFGRNTDAVEEFNAEETEIRAGCFPIETVSGFELKSSEREGWVAVSPTPDFNIRRSCVVSLQQRLGNWRQMARVKYIGGFVLPGDEVGDGQTPLPEDLQQACIEQIVYWYQNRSSVGSSSLTSAAGVTTTIQDQSLLNSVEDTLNRYIRWSV